jgi:hypothetical protein
MFFVIILAEGLYWHPDVSCEAFPGTPCVGAIVGPRMTALRFRLPDPKGLPLGRREAVATENESSNGEKDSK